MSDISKKEEKILKFWQENKIFEKSLEKKAPNGEFVFYDGPPFATGLPHYGHLLAGTMKDVIPRYQTMRGKKVERKWGWDCHGLPLENIVEKELNLKQKKDIEEYGIENFNNKAKESVFRYVDEWEKIVPRMGRFVDMEASYRTMDASYTESVLWVFKELFNKGLVYKGFKSMHLCPRCETTLSNFEVNQGYKEVKDISVTAEFELEDELKTYLLAWTTTPWTLPGNVALAVNPEIDYVKVEKKDDGVGDIVKFILAKDKLSKIFEKDDFKIIETFKGKDLIGKSYKPVFDYFIYKDLENKENAWKIYGADFVNTEEGTGIVHVAPAFGDDDYQLSLKEKLPFIQHVTFNGEFSQDVKEFAGKDVKPKENPQETDIEIIKYLAHKGVLFSKEKISHSYPHCWRCDTPLINYATSSWFVKVTALKEKLLKSNNKISWIPEDLKEGRFGKWLLGARDWSISRARFWGAPIPVWQSEDGKDIEVLGGAEDIREKTKSTNKYILIRHGQAESNKNKFVSTDPNYDDNLTEEGQKQVQKVIKKLKKKKIDLIISSDFVRTKETAEIIKKELDLSDNNLIYDKRLRELDIKKFFKKSWEEYLNYKDWNYRFWKEEEGFESWISVKKRAGEFIYEIDKKYKDKNILIVGHGLPLAMIRAVAEGKQNSFHVRQDGLVLENGEIFDLNFSPIPHNEYFELDFHRPYIDQIEYQKDGQKMKRISDVFDCWFESGSMPFAKVGFKGRGLPNFDPKKGIGFPADFIAEGLDQTRGWFYTLLVLGTALFGKSPYRNVIVNGIVLAEDGQKMSKRLNNYPDPMDIISKYGADSLRYYLMSSPAVRAEDLRFSESQVDEIMKKIVIRIKNIVSLYKMYGDKKEKEVKSKNILDRWIIARLREIRNQTTKSLDNYELDKASRPFLDFVDDFSTWYIRRSRDRLKEKDIEALSTTRFVLKEFSKILAPFMPFLAEEIYQEVKTEKESVHLEDWSKEEKVEKDVLEEMRKLREIVSEALEQRAVAGIKVRQPLQMAVVPFKLSKETEDIFKDEVNVKEVKGAKELKLDFNLTPELIQEGSARDLIRHVQSLRKKEGLVPEDQISISVETDKAGEEVIEKFKDDLIGIANIKDFSFEENDGSDLETKSGKFKIKIGF